jgi:hypothetical protein
MIKRKGRVAISAPDGFPTVIIGRSLRVIIDTAGYDKKPS